MAEVEEESSVGITKKGNEIRTNGRIHFVYRIIFRFFFILEMEKHGVP